MTAYTYRMPYGVQGDVSRPSVATIEAQALDPATPFTWYGVFGKIVNSKFGQIGAGDTAASVYGLLARPNPITGANASDPLGTSQPKTSGMADVMRRGYAYVKVNAGTAAIGGAVYVRTAAPSGAKVIGGVEAAADSTNNFAVTGAFFTSAADSNGIAEIGYNI